MTGKKRGRPQSGKARLVENCFKKHPDRDIDVTMLMEATGLSGDEVRKAIGYLRSQVQIGMAIPIDIVRRGKVWRYESGAKTERVSASVTPMPNTVRGKEVPAHTPVPSTEPEAVFRILGTVKETDELLLSGQTPGVTGVWLAREV